MADFVAAGEGGIVASDDGQTWTRTYGQRMVGIGWSEGLGQYLAVDMDAVTSPDGATWTVQPGFPLGQAKTPLWISGLGLWVCGGSYGSIATSSDGVTWTQGTSGFGSYSIKQFAWSPELGLVVAVAGSYVYTSPDALTWSAGYKISTSLQSGVNLRSVIWCAERGVFLAVGDVGVVATSPDGVTWTSATPLGGDVAFYRVTWSPDLGIFVAVGKAGFIATSPDGVTWTRQTNPYGGLYDDFWGVDWSSKQGIFVLAGRYAHIATSPDGITWAAASQPLSNVTYFDVTTGPSLPPYTGGLLGTRRAFVG